MNGTSNPIFLTMESLIEDMSNFQEMMDRMARSTPAPFTTDRLDGNLRKQAGHQTGILSGRYTKKYADGRQKKGKRKHRG